MKRALAVIGMIAAALVLAWLTALVAAKRSWWRAGREPWPAGLGTLRDFPRQFPKQETSAAAKELMRLAAPLANDHPVHASVATFVARHHARDRVAVDPLPGEIAAFFAAHVREIDAVRDHLLRRGREVAWAMDVQKGFDAPLPNLLTHLRLVRLLAARAQAHGDWNDLHAAAVLVDSLDRRPEMGAQLIALAASRTINAAVWKMPVPPPSWVGAMHGVDRRRLLVRAWQHESWVVWRHLPYRRGSPFGPPGRPFLFVSAANLAEHHRVTAALYLEVLGCGFDPEEWHALRAAELPRWNIPGRALLIDFAAPWARVMRYGAERDATANVLRARMRQPVVERSVCGGVWRYAEGRLTYVSTGWLDREPAPVMPLSIYTRATAAAMD